MRLWLACLLHKTSSYRKNGAGPVSHIPSFETSLETLLDPIRLDAGHPGGSSDFISKQLTMLGPGLTDPESCLFSCTDWVGVAFSSPLDLSLDVSLGLTY